MQVFFYEPDSGRITQSQSGLDQAGIDNLRARGLTVLPVPDGTSMIGVYVQEGALTPRPIAEIAIDKTAIAADDTDPATITGLPDPCTVTVDGVAHDVAGGVLVLTSPMPATYAIALDTWPYMPWSAELVAS